VASSRTIAVVRGIGSRCRDEARGTVFFPRKTPEAFRPAFFAFRRDPSRKKYFGAFDRNVGSASVFDAPFFSERFFDVRESFFPDPRARRRPREETVLFSDKPRDAGSVKASGVPGVGRVGVRLEFIRSGFYQLTNFFFGWASECPEVPPCRFRPTGILASVDGKRGSAGDPSVQIFEHFPGRFVSVPGRLPVPFGRFVQIGGNRAAPFENLPQQQFRPGVTPFRGFSHPTDGFDGISGVSRGFRKKHPVKRSRFGVTLFRELSEPNGGFGEIRFGHRFVEARRGVMASRLDMALFRGFSEPNRGFGGIRGDAASFQKKQPVLVLPSGQPLFRGFSEPNGRFGRISRDPDAIRNEYPVIVLACGVPLFRGFPEPKRGFGGISDVFPVFQKKRPANRLRFGIALFRGLPEPNDGLGEIGPGFRFV
jgi:hypothetical protein